MNFPDPSLEPHSSTEDTPLEETPLGNPSIEAPSLETSLDTPESSQENPMEEYYKLQQALYLVTLGLTSAIFICVWFVYHLNTALNYLLGACVGVVYLRMLAKDVEKIGGQNRKLGFNRLAPVVGVLLIATQLQQLQIVPIFLGFLTYKAAIIVYVLQTTFLPAQQSTQP